MECPTMVIIFLALFLSVSCGNIPSYIHICKRSDPKAVKCIRESVEFIRPKLRSGIPELDVPGLEPLRISDIQISPAAILTDIDVYGASDFHLTKLKLDLAHHSFRIGVTLPLLRLVGKYNLNTRILLVPLQGQGEFTANATNCVANGVLKGQLYKKDGETYLRFTNFNLKLQIGDYNIRLSNLFNGDPVLSKAANDVLNDNRKEFIEAATPFIQDTVSRIILEVSNKIVKNFKYDDVFPEK